MISCLCGCSSLYILGLGAESGVGASYMLYFTTMYMTLDAMCIPHYYNLQAIAITSSDP